MSAKKLRCNCYADIIVIFFQVLGVCKVTQNTGSEQRLRGIYLLPNFLTLIGIFAAFYSIIAAMSGKFNYAAIAILVAVLFDGLDGRVARMANAETAFGAQLDSLADMVSFGLAPSLLLYTWSLSTFGKAGWLVAFLYVACTGLRLARFNVQLQHPDKRYFQGLNTTVSAAFVAALVWAAVYYEISFHHMELIVMVLTIMLALLKVSNIRYRSFKDIDVRNKVSFLAIFLVVLIFVLIAFEPPLVLLVLAALYVFSGPVLTLVGLLGKRRR
jgi:CDP-diacylglycerol--serine O-phosphatidyltransferase